MGATLRILLGEDNEMNRDMLTRRPERRGYEIVQAEDREQGLALARTASPALILMDLTLPVLDGCEAMRRLKGAEETKHIP